MIVNKPIEVGSKLRVVFDQVLPGNENKPPVKNKEEYVCKGIHVDSGGHSHIDIGLELKLNFITSYANVEDLPKTTHWCHPNRFVVID